MWYFRKKSPGEKIRNPIQGEFFATDAIDGPAQALMRESCQNSLDAAAGNQPVRMVFTLCTGVNALQPRDVQDIFNGAWPHYAARGNGLHEPPHPDAACPYLLVEDYGTRGLTGDPAQSDPDADPQKKNPFFLFFRAEGLSAKSGTELGRWGVGKFVFPRSSLASTHFGVTMRLDDRKRLLLGAATLKAHRIAGDDAVYTPDGLFGVPKETDFVLPFDDDETINRFCSKFGVRRNEPGLSVVIPFLDPSITFPTLLQAAARDYFMPIMAGHLEITIKAGTEAVVLTQDSLDQVLRERNQLLGPTIRRHVELTRTALATQPSEVIALPTPDPERAPRWENLSLNQDLLQRISSRLKAGDVASIRVPLFVRRRNSAPVPTHFDVHIQRDTNCDGRPLFIREGIIISDVRGKRAREHVSLVLIEDKPLASMLGDSENPAHTQWQKDSSNFAGKYTAGKSVIDFVTSSVGEIIGILDRSTQEPDASLTIDYFSFDPPHDTEAELEDAARKKPRQKPGDERELPAKPPTPQPAKLRLSKIEGGFSLTSGPATPATPFLLSVKCAYDLRAGNPLKKWDPADFELGRAGVTVEAAGSVSISSVNGNTILAVIHEPDFRLSAIGFDIARDVFVRFDILEAGNAGQTP